jgi:hypothetical protein
LPVCLSACLHACSLTCLPACTPAVLPACILSPFCLLRFCGHWVMMTPQALQGTTAVG